MALKFVFPALAAASMVSAGKVSLLAEKNRPIAKVIKMLRDMKSQLEGESKDDQEVYEKLTCWCKTNREEKTASIELATKRIQQLEASMGEDAARIKQLKAKEIATREENRKNQAALDSATELRMKERKQFHEEEKDSLATIEACKSAVVVLSKHHPELAQLKSIARVLKGKVQGEAKSTIEGMVALKGFLTSVENAQSFLQVPGFQSYAPQSGQVFGMLKTMKETFEANLSTAQKEELAKRDAYKELKAAKEAELKAGREQLANTKSEYAKVKERHAQAEEDRTNTMEQLSIDQEFLANLEEKCAQTDADFARRTKSRNEEIAAVQDTIQILNSDESFDAFNKSVNSFVQIKMSRQQTREQLVKVLSHSTNPKIMLIATYAKLDAFTKVKAAITDMIKELNAQQADEVKHRDFCVSQFHENDLETDKENDNKANLTAKIGELTAQIETLSSEMDQLNKEIGESTTQSNRAGDDRAMENAEFQKVVQDQRVTQSILQKALQRMQQKYAMFFQQPGGNHIELSGSTDGTQVGNGPARFASAGSVDVSDSVYGDKTSSKASGRNAGGQKVIALLNSVITDSKKSENDAIVSERDAQVAYESFIVDANQSIQAKQKAIVQKTEERATANQDKSAAEGALDAAETQLTALGDYKGQLHGSCDFVMNNFDARQQARAEEMEALRQATSILSGSNFSA